MSQALKLKAKHRQPHDLADADSAGLTSGSNVEILESVFKAKVGAVATALWKELLKRRDKQARSRATFKTLVKVSFLPGDKNGNLEWRLRRAMTRLRNLGIVTSSKSKDSFKWVDKRTGWETGGYLMYRTILGQFDEAQGLFVVPRWIQKNFKEGWVDDDGNRRTKGGKRANSGRRKSLKPNEIEGSGFGPKPVEIERKTGEIEGSGFDSSSRPGARVSPQNQVAAGIKPATPCVNNSSNYSDLTVCVSSFQEETQTGSRSLAGSSCASGGQEAHRNLEAATVSTSSPSTGTTISGHGGFRRKWVPTPPELSFASLRPAEVPSPPKLREGMSEDEMLQMMIWAYRGATESRFKGARSKFTMGTRAINRKSQDKLLEVAALLLDSGISPFGWAAFSCDVWKGHHENPPRLDWVFLISRVEQHEGWFKSDLSSYTGRRVKFGPKARALLRRHEVYRNLLAQATTDEHVRLINAGFFPGNLFAEMVEAARLEGELERTRLKAAVERGEWLWS